MKNGSKEFFLAIFFGLHLEELRDFICQGLYLIFMVAMTATCACERFLASSYTGW